MFILTPTSVAKQCKENGLLHFSDNTLKYFILLPLIYVAQQYTSMHCFVYIATIIMRKRQYVTLYVHFLSRFLQMETVSWLRNNVFSIKYGVSQEERSEFWEVKVSIFVGKKSLYKCVPNYACWPS